MEFLALLKENLMVNIVSSGITLPTTMKSCQKYRNVSTSGGEAINEIVLL